METISLSARIEDYLLAIFLLGRNPPPVKVSDISKMLHVKASSVTETLEKLSAAGLVKHEKHRAVELTVKGLVIARDVHRRYETLRKLLFEILNVPLEIAEQDAKGMKHALSKTSQERMARLMEGLLEHRSVREGLQQ